MAKAGPTLAATPNYNPADLMKRRHLALLAVLVYATPLEGQDRSVELGFDGGFQFFSYGEGEDGTSVMFPFRAIRVGAGVAPYVGIELAGSFSRSSFDEGSVTSLYVFPSLVLSTRPSLGQGSSASARSAGA